MSTESKILLGITGAALAGIALGMMAAPCSGTELRSKIRRNAGSIVDRLLLAVGNKSGTWMDKAESALDAARAKFHEAKGYMKAQSNDWVGQLDEVVETTKDKYHEAKGYAKAKTSRSNGA